MAYPGLLEWGNSIRFSMANDPGREFFQEQIHTHGFLFLDDYLNNILAKPKQDALIDLVKTPSRRKNQIQVKKQKTNPSPSKLKTVVTLEDLEEKENTAPVNSFHQALLKAQGKDEDLEPTCTPSAQFLDSAKPVLQDHARSKPVPEETTVPTLSIPSIISILPESDDVAMKHVESTVPLELSVIAEDDESAERSRHSIRPASESAGMVDVLPSVEEGQPMTEKEREVSEEERINQEHEKQDALTLDTAMSSVDTFHTVSLESPKPEVPQSIVAPEIPDPHPPSILPENTSTTKPHEYQSEDVTPTLNDEDTCPQNEVALSQEDHTTSVPLYPTLPALMPIRKSVRVPRDGNDTGPLGAATPGNAIVKRTSWLIKSREVKALETGSGKVNANNPQTFAIPGVSLQNSNKRKSGDMLGPGIPGSSRDGAERSAKVAKTAENDTAPSKVDEVHRSQPKEPVQAKEEIAIVSQDEPMPLSEPQNDEQQGMLNQLKKTVEGLGARFGKSTGKSLGGGVLTNALAEARAAAEARVAERNRLDDDVIGPMDVANLRSSQTDSTMPIASEVPTVSKPPQARLSVSDLVTSDEKEKKTDKKNIFSLFPPEHENKLLSQTTKVVPAATATVSPFTNLFNKTSPVFVPPSPPAVKAAAKTEQPVASGSVFSKPAPMSIGLSPRLPSSPPMSQQNRPAPVSAQSTMESIKSDASDKIFGSQEAPAWMPSSQDTEYSAFGTQSQYNQLDDDDSWPIDEKLEDRIKQWPFNNNRDSLTWSSAPTDTHKSDTQPMDAQQLETTDIRLGEKEASRQIPESFDMDVDGDDEVEDDEEPIEPTQEMSIEFGKSTVSLVEPKVTKDDSQTSMVSTSQSQPSSGGFFGHASKLVSSVLGTNKKPKTEVKSLQLAAAAAKRQQEEKDKKAAVLKNMESRRQLVLQKKAEEEKTRQLEEERKIKEEAERRKREREEHTDKRPIKPVVPKKEEDLTGKRKIELKKPTPSGLNSSTSTKPSTFKPASKQTPITHNSNAIAGPSSSTKPLPNSMSKARAKTPGKGADDEYTQPSQLIQNQMTARAKAQIQAAKQTEPVIPSESIELPEINSEYSDSEDEDRPKNFNPPDWAQSPELRQQLQMQSTINPDEIFGAIQPLRMEEIFRNGGRTSRFRARTSSANWSGSDRLTAEEEREYVQRMGFR
ncbi:tat-binding protein 7 [Moniliophthora roreri MCA 2997]|uniref:Tat-binding protein 7 n=1 Tax=Moniliophthora roreri (strain MCA 2997) TaxID=1381753 RepID=V2WIL3_MONRO|nr:tat-binding protein 7 [Moniliophthora roreri MCA 2997]